MKTFIAVLVSLALIFVIGGTIFFNATPFGVEIRNTWFGWIDKADENSRYENQKMVENTCRSMIAQYNSDKLRYQQYRNSELSEEREWAVQAKMRANDTASTYNNYILKNKYIWQGNVPNDIFMNLPYLE